MQVVFDMLRGALALALVVLAAAAIIYLIVPGIDYPADRVGRGLARGRMITSMFGGVGILMMAMFLTIGILSAINR